MDEPGASDTDRVEGPQGELETRSLKLNRWRAAGIDPFGARFEWTHRSDQIREGFASLQGSTVALAGRLMALRRQGRVAFADLQDAGGRIQLFLRADTLGTEALAALLQCDLGDIVGVEGTVMRTRMGEVSVEPSSFVLLTKALRPLPDKFHGLRDTEVRYRRRYLDLIANPEVRDAFVRRSRMITGIRRFLDTQGFLEVETPVLQTLAGGTSARPFVTHHHALDIDLYLRIALELHLKRLVVGGLDRVYEIGRVFRNEGVSTRHNPEFTMLECYQAYADYEDMMRLTEGLFSAVAQDLYGTSVVQWQGREINLAPPWRRVSMITALAERGVDVLGHPTDEGARALAGHAGVKVEAASTWGQVVDALVDALILPELVQPTFLTDHPIEISPLARSKSDDPRLVYRFEAIIGGLEMANAFSELNDPEEQRHRFEQQAAERAKGNDEAQLLDEDFVRALEHGMPPTGGLGIGVDRMAMLMTDATSIRDVLLFPHMRPEK